MTPLHKQDIKNTDARPIPPLVLTDISTPIYARPTCQQVHDSTNTITYTRYQYVVAIYIMARAAGILYLQG